MGGLLSKSIFKMVIACLYLFVKLGLEGGIPTVTRFKSYDNDGWRGNFRSVVVKPSDDLIQLGVGICKTEGFLDVEFIYVGGMWVMCECSDCTCYNFCHNEVVQGWFNELIKMSQNFGKEVVGWFSSFNDKKDENSQKAASIDRRFEMDSNALDNTSCIGEITFSVKILEGWGPEPRAAIVVLGEPVSSTDKVDIAIGGEGDYGETVSLDQSFHSLESDQVLQTKRGSGDVDRMDGCSLGDTPPLGLYDVRFSRKCLDQSVHSLDSDQVLQAKKGKDDVDRREGCFLGDVLSHLPSFPELGLYDDRFSRKRKGSVGVQSFI
ncbi:hypothetical protein L2E82_47379 [Cichorium intybus]|uniref:Uncharacterized protein n=1 Tax=Cichorium intybus TaxID=13427 RepID=A0ACB8YUK1_CICIN|nr:hypothetical protein L2E82_47379 [Cichorium intybus]